MAGMPQAQRAPNEPCIFLDSQRIARRGRHGSAPPARARNFRRAGAERSLVPITGTNEVRDRAALGHPVASIMLTAPRLLATGERVG
jgi:hypothetical protein